MMMTIALISQYWTLLLLVAIFENNKEISCFDEDHAVFIRLHCVGSGLIIVERVENCVFHLKKLLSPFGLFQNVSPPQALYLRIEMGFVKDVDVLV